MIKELLDEFCLSIVLNDKWKYYYLGYDEVEAIENISTGEFEYIKSSYVDFCYGDQSVLNIFYKCM